MAERIVVVGKFGDDALCIDSGLFGGKAAIHFDVGCQISKMSVVKQLPEVYLLSVDGSLELLVTCHRKVESDLSDICQEIGLCLNAAIRLTSHYSAQLEVADISHLFWYAADILLQEVDGAFRKFQFIHLSLP